LDLALCACELRGVGSSWVLREGRCRHKKHSGRKTSVYQKPTGASTRWGELQTIGEVGGRGAIPRKQKCVQNMSSKHHRNPM
jgi:hypothetical protein